MATRGLWVQAGAPRPEGLHRVAPNANVRPHRVEHATDNSRKQGFRIRKDEDLAHHSRMSLRNPVTSARTAARRLLVSTCVVVAAAEVPTFSLAASPETPTVARARELVDSFFGRRENLSKAAALLKTAYKANPQDANVYLQAARVTIFGGFLGFGRYEPGSFAAYTALLDRSIELDPTIPKAHLLKAQIFHARGQVQDELSELDTAKKLGSTDPWLKLGYADYYRDVGQRFEAYRMYREIEDAGPGKSASERVAFCQVLEKLQGWRVGDEDMIEKRRQLAATALKSRDPADALTPLDWAEIFIGYGMFDDGIAYARESKKTRDFVGARLALATGLYAKAAQQITAGTLQTDPNVQALIREASGLHMPRSALLRYLDEFQEDSKLRTYRSVLEKIIL
jgi:tetratricopeptide (TPR) repeat protein